VNLYLPQGYRFSGVRCGLKKSAGALDISLIVSDLPAVAAGVYTQNLVVAAPVTLCRSKTPTSHARAVIVNSGNANACTGRRGAEDAAQMCQWTAETLGAAGPHRSVDQEQVLVMSTGVIGRYLAMDKVQAGILQAVQELSNEPSAFLRAADGILTTDKARKVTTRRCTLGGRTIHIAGMAKGAGMIGPNMATMLCCVLTDACLTAEQSQRMLQVAADRSFNNISVEGHTSTNDSMILMANGAAGGPSLASAEEESEFAQNLEAMCIELAKQIPADGEGATHLIEIRVSGAECDSDARKIAVEVARSNLVKCAILGADPNWGRIVSAVGYAGVKVDVQRLDLRINGIQLFAAGEPVGFDAAQASRSIRDQFETTIELTVGNGTGRCTHWTSDLTPAYVEFNSAYTT